MVMLRHNNSQTKVDSTPVLGRRFGVGWENRFGLWGPRESGQASIALLRGMVWALVALGLAGLMWRGGMRGLAASTDWKMLFAATQAWWQGVDPYQFESLYAVWREGGGSTTGSPLTGGVWTAESFHALYPPGTFVLLGLVAGWPGMTWAAAKVMWVVVNMGLIIGLALWMHQVVRGWVKQAGGQVDGRVDGLPGGRPGGQAVAQSEVLPEGLPGRLPGAGVLPGVAVALVLMLGAGHTAVMQGQLSIVVVVCAVVGLSRQTWWGAGVWLGLACVLKPQIGLPLSLGWFAYRRDWLRAGLVFGVAVVVMMVFHIVGVWRLTGGLSSGGLMSGAWVEGLKANLNLLADNGYTDARPGSRYGFQLVDGAPVGWLVTGREQGAKVIAMGGALLLGLLGAVGVWVRGVREAGQSLGAKTDAWRLCSKGFGGDLGGGCGCAWAWMSLLASTLMWVTYHRYYDGVVYLFAIGWLMKRLIDLSVSGPRLGGRRLDGVTLGLACCIGLWMWPMGSTVMALVKREWIPAYFGQAWWSRMFVIHCANWATLGIAVLAVVTLWRKEDR